MIGLVGCGRAEALGDEPREPDPSPPVPTGEATVAPEAAAREDSVLEGQAADTRAPASVETSAGWFAEATLENAAFETPGAPSVVVHAPPDFDATEPLDLVVFVHGWRGCARQLAQAGEVSCSSRGRPLPGWDLAGRFDEAQVNALFIVPQLAFLRRSGSAGAFTQEGRFAAFLEEMLGAIRDRIGPPSTLARVRSITILAHSAGYETTLALLSRGGVANKIRSIVLFDALYRGHLRFADWVAEPATPERRLISLHGRQGRTVSQSLMLAARLRDGLGDELSVHAEGSLSTLIQSHRVVVAHAGVPHGDVPAHHMAEVLRALLPGAPP